MCYRHVRDTVGRVVFAYRISMSDFWLVVLIIVGLGVVFFGAYMVIQALPGGRLDRDRDSTPRPDTD